MKAKQDSNLRYGTVLHSTKDAMLPSIKGGNRQYRSNKNLDFVIFQDDYCCNSMVGVEDSNPKGFNTPPLTTNELSYARNGIASKAQHLWAFLLFAIDFGSTTKRRFLNYLKKFVTIKHHKSSVELLIRLLKWHVFLDGKTRQRLIG